MLFYFINTLVWHITRLARHLDPQGVCYNLTIKARSSSSGVYLAYTRSSKTDRDSVIERADNNILDDEPLLPIVLLDLPH